MQQIKPHIYAQLQDQFGPALITVYIPLFSLPLDHTSTSNRFGVFVYYYLYLYLSLLTIAMMILPCM